MARFTKAIHLISRWLNRRLGPVLPVADALDEVQVTDRDIAEDLAYGRD